MICVITAAVLLTLPGDGFRLSWVHSVEKTLWSEEWVAVDRQLKLVSAQVQGSGAGIALPDDAMRVQGGWKWIPSLGPQRQLNLAASGATLSGWEICSETQCQSVGADGGDEAIIRVCDG